MARRYLAAGVVAAALVTAAGAAVLRHEDGGTSPKRRPAAASAPTSAERIFFAESDHVSSARLDGRSLGSATTQLFNRGPDLNAPAWPSPDRRWLLLSDGELIDLTADKPVAPVQAVPLELIVGSAIPEGVPQGRLSTGSPWAHHSRRLVVADGDRMTSVDLATGATTPLGTGLLPAGDPVSNGAAFVAAGRPPELSGPQDFFVDYFAPVAAIARVSAGAPPVVLATGAQLAAALGGRPGSTVVAGHLSFSPDGSRLAVELALLDGARRAGGVAVLDRGGGIVDVAPTPFAHSQTWLAWSPKDGSLAFGIQFPRNNFVTADEPPFLEPQLWRPGSGKARPITVPVRGNAPVLSPCLWSPDGASLLCGDELSWPVLTVATGKARVLDTVPGRPLAWVPAYAGKPRG